MTRCHLHSTTSNARGRSARRDTPHAADAASAPRRRDRPRHLRQTRKSQSDRRVQGSRRPQPRGVAIGKRAIAGHHHRQHRQSRPIDGVRVAACRRAVHRCGAARKQSEKNAAMRAFGATVVEQGKDFDEAREWVEHEASDPRAALRALRERAAVDRRRRHLRAGDIRGISGSRRHLRADRRRQRRLRVLHRPNRTREEDARHRRAGGRGATHSRARGAGRSACRWKTSRRSPKGSRRGIRSI